jgi:hypothetical protein
MVCAGFSSWSEMPPQTVPPSSPVQQQATPQGVPDVGRFIQIPGPNPILVRGDATAWDGGSIEAANVLKDGETYYLYYSAMCNRCMRFGELTNTEDGIIWAGRASHRSTASIAPALCTCVGGWAQVPE